MLHVDRIRRRVINLLSKADANMVRSVYRELARVGSASSGQPDYSTTNFDSDNDLNIPATKTARWSSYGVRCVNPRSKHCQGHLWHPTRSNCLRFCGRPPNYDSGTFHPIPLDRLLAYVYLGHDGQRSGFRRPWTGLR